MKRNIMIMYTMSLLQGMVFYGPIATLYRQVHGITVFQITLIESISIALCLLLEVPWGILADKIGYRRTMIICSWLYFASKIIFWQAKDFTGFLIERLILSVVYAGLSGVDSGILYLSCGGKEAQKVFGQYDSFGMLGLLIAAVVFSVFVKDHYQLAGLLTVFSYGAAALLSLGIREVRETKPEEREENAFRQSLKETIGNGTHLLFLIAVGLLFETHQTITVFLNQIKYESCGLNDTAIGIIYGIATLLGVTGFCSVFVTKRLGRIRSLSLFSLLPLTACLLLAFTNTAGPAVIGVLTLRISDTLFRPFQEKINNDQIRTKNRATVLSIYSMIVSGVGIVTNLIFGFFSDRSLTAAFLFGGGICFLSLVFFVIWYLKNRGNHFANPDKAANP